MPDELVLPDIINFMEGEKAPLYADSLKKLLNQLSQPALPVGPFLTTVPVLPLHFVQRKQVLDALELLVKGDGIRPIVIAGAKQAIALVGMGGLGKSVMAAALARSARARRFFRDGIIWIEIGERGTLLDAARTLLHVFGQPDWNAGWRQIRVQLPALIGSRTCLIVLDDLWSAGDMRTIQGSLGNSGRLMMTTRDSKLAEDLDAPVVQQLEQMNENEALHVLASWVEMEPVSLPPIAGEVARECGYLPLALALCGAQVHEGLPWSEVLNALKEADPEVLSKVFVVMGTSVKMLQSTDPLKAALYESLSVFPSDRPIPLAAIATWWRAKGLQSDRHVYTALLTLRGKALLSLNGKIPDAQITLHDLQFDYLHHITNETKKERHKAIVAAYYTISNGDWLQLPNDGYILEHVYNYSLVVDGKTLQTKKLTVAR